MLAAGQLEIGHGDILLAHAMSRRVQAVVFAYENGLADQRD